MKLILFCWKTHTNQILHDNLVEMGHEVTDFSEPLSDFDVDQSFSMKLLQTMERTGCEGIISFNYFPIVAEICQVRGVNYISWVFDCPHSTLFSKTVFYNTNRIFVFDRNQYLELASYGVEHLFHMPLAADANCFQRMEAAEYRADISFLGGLYTGEKDFYSQISFLPEYVRGYLEAVMESQRLVYGYNFVKDMLTEPILSELKKYVKFDFGERYFIPYENMIATMLNKRVTIKERENVLQLLSKNHQVNLYTGSDTKNLPLVHNKGYADYMTQMPKVFYNSRINLNITLKSISSGIPLRALDIMACGGFLLSNYQPELAESFTDGEELVLYTDMADLQNKVDYYLSHEAERKQIAENGFRKVTENFSYKKKLEQIFERV